MCPTLGGKVAEFDPTAAQALPGVRKVIALEPMAGSALMPGKTSGGVAVIADTPFQAMRALPKVAVEWDHGPAAIEYGRSLVLGYVHRRRVQHGLPDPECSLLKSLETLELRCRRQP
jgi:hypothetical protein